MSVFSPLFIQNEDTLYDNLHTALHFQNSFPHTDPSVKVCAVCLSEVTSVELSVVSGVWRLLSQWHFLHIKKIKKKSHGTPESEGTLGKYLAVASENQKCQME